MKCGRVKRTHFFNEKTGTLNKSASFFVGVPGMGNNLTVKVRYTLGSRKC